VKFVISIALVISSKLASVFTTFNEFVLVISICTVNETPSLRLVISIVLVLSIIFVISIKILITKIH